MNANNLSIIVALASLVAIVGCGEQEQEKQKPATPVRVYVVEPDSISAFVKSTGAIVSDDETIVFSKIGERIVRVNAKAGDYVRRGQVLAVQKNDMLRQAIKSAEASLTGAKINLEQLAADHARVERLYNQNAVSKQQYDQITAQKNAAEATLDQAKAGLAQAKENYDNSFIRTPISGELAALYVDKNQMLPAGQPVAQIVGSRVMKTKLKLSAKDAATISEGQRVVAKFPALPDVELEGVVSVVDRALEPNTKLLTVEARFEGAPATVKSGMYGEYLVEVERRRGVVTLPMNAVMSQTEVELDRHSGKQTRIVDYYVFLVEDGKAERVVVTPGLESNGLIEITAGVKFGDKVVVVGQNIVKNGDRVNVVEDGDRQSPGDIQADTEKAADATE
ncbi:MAG: efflux RND transporter periplasmic adaptor subunit [Ignavibacteriales bacterium]|nr:efflux RND transporter periplasmic adaptor subunit [Ignavibacteriales bacterium]